MRAGLKTVVALAFVLAAGFLLVILSCALFGNWLPLIVAFIFVFAPLPNAICSRFAGADDYAPEYNSAYSTFGNFLTGILLSSGLSLPLILLHSQLIRPEACWMSIAGGGLVYGTVIGYGWVFREREDVL